ncbi:MAG: ABC transporter ATP-binding protein [Myxococcales bacterium]|nr:ABC transporter ATP-binding protein [Myxococcales bacterium]
MISVEKVTKYYGAVAAVRDLDFRIEQGECVGFLGLNGAGKSTTLKLLACMLLPTSGRIRVEGRDAESEPHEIRKRLGFLPDQPPLYPELTVVEYLRFAGRLRQMRGEDLERRLWEVLDVCALHEVQHQVIGTLSHGYRQRVGIAQAIIHRPALLILDEPIQGLDPVQIVEMREMIRGLRGKHTILLSTHILSEIERTCDRILVLHEGRIAAEGTEEDLARKLGAGMTIDVEVRVADGSTALRDVLGRLDGVLGVEVGEADGEGCVRATLRTSRDVREELARALVSAGHGLRRLERSATGLERIFVSVTGQGRAAPS